MKILSNLSDEELLELLKSDNQQALSVLFDRYWVKLLSVASHRLNDVTLGEDCVQNVFLSLWERRQSLAIKHSFSTYLSVSVKYQVIKHMVAERKRKDQSVDVIHQQVLSTTVMTDDLLLGKETSEMLSSFINELPEKCKIVFKMSREDGFSNKEISQKLNLSIKTVEAHITKAIKELKGKIQYFNPEGSIHQRNTSYFRAVLLRFFDVFDRPISEGTTKTSVEKITSPRLT